MQERKKSEYFCQKLQTFLKESKAFNSHFSLLIFCNTVKFQLETPKEEITGLRIQTPFIIRNNTVDVNVTWHFSFTGN